jgi:hypothetical protein
MLGSKKGAQLNMIGLFDGGSGMLNVLHNILDIPQSDVNYYRSEINPNDNNVVRDQYYGGDQEEFDKFELGDVTKVNTKELKAQIEEMSGNPIHLVVSGSPCQDMSSLGKNAGRHGEKSGLIVPYLQMLSDLEPEHYLFENVIPRNSADRKYFDVMHSAIRNKVPGYESLLKNETNPNKWLSDAGVEDLYKELKKNNQLLYSYNIPGRLFGPINRQRIYSTDMPGIPTNFRFSKERVSPTSPNFIEDDIYRNVKAEEGTPNYAGSGNTRFRVVDLINAMFGEGTMLHDIYGGPNRTEDPEYIPMTVNPGTLTATAAHKITSPSQWRNEFAKYTGSMPLKLREVSDAEVMDLWEGKIDTKDRAFGIYDPSGKSPLSQIPGVVTRTKRRAGINKDVKPGTIYEIFPWQLEELEVALGKRAGGTKTNSPQINRDATGYFSLPSKNSEAYRTYLLGNGWQDRAIAYLMLHNPRLLNMYPNMFKNWNELSGLTSDKRVKNVVDAVRRKY